MAALNNPQLLLSQLSSLDVTDALIFADDPAAAAIACTVGLPSLLEHGVANVLRLGDTIPSPTHLSLTNNTPTHAIVLCSTFLPSSYSSIRGSLCQPGLNLSQITIACTFSERAHAEFAAASSSTTTSSAAEPTGADAPLPPTVGAYDACAAEIKLWPIHRSAESDALSPPLDVRIVHLVLPAQLCPLGSAAFLLSADGAQPLLESDLEEMRTEDAPPPSKLDDIAWSSLPPPRQRSLGGCAMSLVGLLRAAAIKPSLFALGSSSVLVARQVLQHLPTSGSGSSGTPAAASSPAGSGGDAASSTVSGVEPTEASVLIVDRSLDLVAPSLTTDHPLDALFAASDASTDADDPWRSLNNTASAPSPADAPVAAAAAPKPPLPLPIVQALSSAEPACSALLDAILTRSRMKEVHQQLLKLLTGVVEEYADEDEDEMDLPLARPTPTALRELLTKLRDTPRIGIERLPDLEACSTLLDACDDASGSIPTAELISHQKVLQHTASESTQAAFTELLTLAQRAHTVRRTQTPPPSGTPSSVRGSSSGSGEEALGVRSLLPLLAMFYSLVGASLVTNSTLEEHEQRLREALLQACLRDPSCGGLLEANAPRLPPEALGAEQLMERRSKLSAVLSTIFERLRALASARKGLGASEALLLSSAQTAGEVYRPLLRHVLERALRHYEVPEMTRLSASIGSLFSRGANLLGVKRQQRLTDHKTILIFVLGGISLNEIRELRQLVAQHPKHRLILGATQMITPDAVWELLTKGLSVR